MICGMKTNLNVYFSAECNLACEYCAITTYHPEENDDIRNAIANGSFQTEVLNQCEELQPVTLGIWGMEPSINQDLWGSFIRTILLGCDTIKGIFVSTNGLTFDAAQWYAPLYEICNQQQRKIKLWIQWSIDGPQYFSQAKQHLLNAITAYETNEYFRVKLSTKSSLTAANLMEWDKDEWYDYMTNLHAECNDLAVTGCDVSLVGAPPTLVRPGNYTKADGERWAYWVPKTPEHVLLPNITCAAGISSFTIDYQGNVYDCQLKVNNTEHHCLDYDTFMQHAIPLFIAGEIENHNWPELYKVIASQYCWANSSFDNLDSYIKVWGNGAVPIALSFGE